MDVKVDTRKLDLIIARTRSDAEKVAEQSAQAIKRDAQARAPKRTRELASGIHIEVLGPAERAIADNVFYGRFAELGEGPYPPKPFMMPAMKAEEKRLVKRMKKILLP